MNAIIHANRPDLFNFNQLLSYSDIENLNHALEIVHSELGIPKLFEAEGISIKIKLIFKCKIGFEKFLCFFRFQLLDN